MASLENLPADQRAVLALVLQRGRSFDDIAALLSIDRAAVRERALKGLEALGPETDVDPARRALIADYLLGQLPPRVAEGVRGELGTSASQRAWARVLAGEIAPLSSRPLPEIPPASQTARAEHADHEVDRGEPARGEPSDEPAAVAPLALSEAPGARTGGRSERDPARPRPRSSRTGGAILLGVVLLVVIAAVIVIITTSGGSSSKSSTQASISTTATASASTGSSATATSSTSSARPVAQVNLTSPSGNAAVKGVAIVVKQGTAEGLVIRAQGVPANTKSNAYAVWLSNSGSDERILGFVNPGVTATGVLQTAGALPAGAAHYKQLLVTLESQAKPRAHGTVILQGALSLTG